LKIGYEITNHAHKFKSCVLESLLPWSKFEQKSSKWAYKTMYFHDVILYEDGREYQAEGLFVEFIRIFNIVWRCLFAEIEAAQDIWYIQKLL